MKYVTFAFMFFIVWVSLYNVVLYVQQGSDDEVRGADPYVLELEERIKQLERERDRMHAVEQSRILARTVEPVRIVEEAPAPVVVPSDARFDHPSTGLTLNEQAQVLAMISSQKEGMTEANMSDKASAYRRKYALIEFLDGLIGGNRRKVVADQLWVQAGEFHHDHVPFFNADPLGQKLFSMLCYPCDPKERTE